MFRKILISNRGEIACRIIRTCRRLGIATVAVYSDADRSARHVHEADEAVCIGPAEATQSYLNVDRIVTAAKTHAVDAIHPGYGFLSENGDFANRCAAENIVFIGPDSVTIELMGSKSAAKKLMEDSGVPTVPGYHGDDQSDGTLVGEAERIGYPLMIKASAGGGGKGMRIVETAAEFESALSSARREAAGAFGNDEVLIERYLKRPRHIEVQVFGDRAGNHVHLFERECSIQRRHQKVIEESPSPFLTGEQRDRMCAAALDAARAVNYVNAGTVEFIVDENHEFFFMEMNTRLQVEHPVTEMVTGFDLVEWQIRVAAGESLPATQTDITSTGHAIEARIYAENPYRDYLPSTGTVTRFEHPHTGDRLRLDSGISDGDTVGIHYDPMLAKLIVWDTDREVAVAKLRDALTRTTLFGLVCNIPLLRRVAQHEAFERAEIDTGFLDRHQADLTGEPAEPGVASLVAAACRVMLDRQVAATISEHLAQGVGGTPWDRCDGWQVNGLTRNRLTFTTPTGDTHSVSVSGWNGRFTVDVGERTLLLKAAEVAENVIEIRAGEETKRVVVIRYDRHQLITADSATVELELGDPWPQRAGPGDEEAHPGSPLPGRIVTVNVAEGDRVEQGQALLVLEGMKMEYTLKARAAGTIERLHVTVGDQVEAEVPLVDILPDTADGGT